MVRVEIENEMQIIRQEIEVWQERRAQAIQNRDKTNEDIEIICKNKEKVETELQDTFNRITSNLEKISGKNRFKERYLERTREILWGNNTSEVMDEISNVIREAKNKVLEYDDLVDEYATKIYTFEQEINSLVQQLNQMGQGGE